MIDRRLFIAKVWHYNCSGGFYSASFEANGARGFHYFSSNGMMGRWTMNRWFRRQEREARKLYNAHLAVGRDQ